MSEKLASQPDAEDQPALETWPDVANGQVDLDQRPSIDNLQTLAVSPKYRVCNLLVTCAIFGTLLLCGLVVQLELFFSLEAAVSIGVSIAMGVIFLLGLLIFVYHWFADPLVRYGVREQDIVLSKGLIFYKRICQPLLRVQHIEVNRGPIQRLAGLASIQVFSAGGESHTLEIPGLPLATAEALRQFILDHKDLNAR
jgi:membrane protein YdbS with pleckstrin-like domain